MYQRWAWLLTVAAGGALPALLANAAERVSVHHTCPSVLTRTRQAAAVLRWETQTPVSLVRSRDEASDSGGGRFEDFRDSRTQESGEEAEIKSH